MMPMDFAGMDLGLRGKNVSVAAKQGGVEGKQLFESVLDGNVLQGLGISKERLAELIDQSGNGKNVPLDGKLQQGELADLLGEIGQLDGKKLDGKNLDLELITEQSGGEQGGQSFVANVLLLGEDSQGQSWGIKFSGEGKSADLTALQAERDELLQILSELKEKGLEGEKLIAAFEQRLTDLEDAGKLKHLDLAEIEISSQEQLQDSQGRREELFAGMGSLSIGGDAEKLAGERSITQNALGEQIFRELRAGGSLAFATGGEGNNLAEQNSSSGGFSSGGEQQGNTDSLLQALEGASRRGEEANVGRTADFGSLFAAAQGLDSAARGSSAVQLNVQQPVGQNGFTHAVGERVEWMVKEGVKEARLQLNPPGMGPLDVQVTVGEERTTVSIIAHNATTREALQDDLQRLRQMLTEQGNDDVEVNVSSGEGGADREDTGVLAGGEGAPGEGWSEAESGDETAQDFSSSDASGSGIVDHFA